MIDTDPRKTAIALEDKFYSTGKLDPGEWIDLSRRFDQHDRPHAAIHTLEKLGRLSRIIRNG